VADLNYHVRWLRAVDKHHPEQEALSVPNVQSTFGLMVSTAFFALAVGPFFWPGEVEAMGASNVRPSISFRFRPEMVNGKSSFHVTETFRAWQAETEIVVPTRWGGAPHLEDQTQNLRVDPPDAKLSDHPSDVGEKLLRARPGERITLSYDIVPLQTEWFHHPQEHMAIVNADYFLFNPQNALVYPDMSSSSEVDVTYDWRSLPKTMPILTSFGINQRVIRVHAPWIRIADGLLAGGNFRVSRDQENGTTLVVAVRGIWKFSDAELLEKCRQVFDEENKFWHTAAMPYFLVTLAPFDDRTGDNDGSGFTNAYMLFLSHEDTIDSERIRLMAHEMFHHWNPMSMGQRESDEVATWFAEGFTTYYAGVITLRGGLSTYTEYLEYLNLWLGRYQSSDLREIKEADWKAVAHSSREAYELPYERGAAIALWADAAIRKRTKGQASLDNVMLDLVKEGHPASLSLSFTEERVISAFAPYLSGEEMTQLRSMAIDGALVQLPEKLGSCAELTEKTQAVVDPGFDQKTSFAQKHVVGVVPDGPAYRAGLRDGQELFRWSIYNDDPSKEALLGVVVNGERKTITFSPATQRETKQYSILGNNDETSGCLPF
jgi:predicted metalloprotease with PDZ domain